MQNKNVFVITHANDLDGIASAALLRMKYNMPLQNLFFTDYSDKWLKYAVSGIERKAKNNGIIFITDLRSCRKISKSTERKHISL